MRKTILHQILFGVFLSVIALLPLSAHGQLSYVTNLSFAADHTADEHKALAISANGDMYLSINAQKLSILNSSNLTTDIMNTINTLRAGMLVKVDSNNNVLWSNLVAGDAASAKNSQVISAKEVGEFIYVVGGVSSNKNTPSPVNVFGVGIQSQGFMDMYIAKLNSSTGETSWVKSFGSARDWEMFINIDADANGNIYTAGYFGNISTGPLVFTENFKLSVNGNWGEDYFIVRFNANGDVVWAKNFGSKFREHDDIFGLSIDKNGDALLAITSNDRSRANLTSESEVKREYIVGNTTYYLYPEDKKSDALLVKLAATDGGVLWSRFFTGTGNQRLEHVTALSGAADVVVVGRADQNIVVQGSTGLQEVTISHPLTTGSNYFIMAFDANGNNLWYNTPQGEIDVRTLCDDNENGFYIGGSFNTYAALNAEVILQATDGNVKEGLLARYAANGDCIWGRTVQGIGGQSVKRIDVKGGRIAISGDRISDAIFPFYETPVAYDVNNVLFKWYALSYHITSFASGLDKVENGDVKFNNPVVGGMLNLMMNSSFNSEHVLQIVDISGRTLLNKLISVNSGNNTIDVSKLNAGIYLMKINDQNGKSIYTDKLIVK